MCAVHVADGLSANERSPSGLVKAWHGASHGSAALPCGRASLAHAESLMRGTPTGDCAGVQRRTPIPDVHVSGNEGVRAAGRDRDHPPPTVACTPLPRSRRTCSSCSPAAEHVRLPRSSQPVPSTTTSHGARHTSLVLWAAVKSWSTMGLFGF